jgi:hypothetical protein
MKNHLVSDKIAKLQIYYPPKTLQGVINNVGLTFSVGDTILRFTISIELNNKNQCTVVNSQTKRGVG